MYLGENRKKLGFGFMRLPHVGDEIDLEQVKKMVDLFLSRGFTYFDTAYVYDGGKSEEAMREALVKRYPRDSFTIATKLPLWNVGTSFDDFRRLTDTSLQRLGVDYVDFYLVHNINNNKYEECNVWEYMKELKAEGKAKHIGFSFHGTPELLEKVLSEHDEAEFVQLQINYNDWDSPNIASGKCYEIARAHHKPVVIMEPVKGGALATLTDEVAAPFRALDPNASNASFAIRYAASLDGIIAVLSGMSTLAQVEDNVSFMDDFKKLDDRERAAVAEVVENLAKVKTIPCTSCKYCVEGCPMSINIPGVISALNVKYKFNNVSDAKRQLGFATRGGGKPSDCVGCQACEGVCPQHLPIPEIMKEAAETLE
ncbi:MAG: aldo/keto reductase [Clostridia bacterium]|nr:aldo/keto reductase [Clostridia bacterium]